MTFNRNLSILAENVSSSGTLGVASDVSRTGTLSTAISGPDTLYDEINSLLTSAGGVSYLAWEYATEVTRNGQLVNALANQLGWTQTQLDDLFVTASNIFS